MWILTHFPFGRVRVAVASFCAIILREGLGDTKEQAARSLEQKASTGIVWLMVLPLRWPSFAPLPLGCGSDLKSHRAHDPQRGKTGQA